jgi:hypothetical protein
VKKTLLLGVCLWAGLWPAFGQVAILHIQVVEGEGAVHMPGTRSLRPLTVAVTDETGKPVEGATVSFHLPEAGPGGSFGNQLRTDVAITDVKGLASLHSLQVNRTPGPFQIRIVAAKEQARAGIICSQYIAGTKSEKVSAAVAHPAPTSAPTASRGTLKWIVLAVAVSGAAAAGALLAGRSGAGTSSSATGAAPVIGTPIITVGKP